jgi:hypothetical protein
MTIEFKAPGIKRQHAIKQRRAPKRPTHGSTSSNDAERELDAAIAAKRDAERRARFRLHHQDPMGARSAAAAVSDIVSENVSETASETAGASAAPISGDGVVAESSLAPPAPSPSSPSSLRRPKPPLSVEDRKWKREITRWKANKR